MESPADYLDSPLVDSDDVAFPCKGCGEVNISILMADLGHTLTKT